MESDFDRQLEAEALRDERRQVLSLMYDYQEASKNRDVALTSLQQVLKINNVMSQKLALAIRAFEKIASVDEYKEAGCMMSIARETVDRLK